MTEEEVKYGYKVCESIATKFLDTPALGRDDLVQIGMEGIVRELHDHPHLREYKAWMGKVARWEMNNALAKLLGRRGKTRQGKERQQKEQPIYWDSTEFEPSYEPDLGEELHAQEILALLTEKQQEAVELLSRGYRQTEIGRMLGISQAAVMDRRDGARHKLEVVRV